MKLIAGLGNPGSRYAGTRHNVGFEALDRLATRWKADLSRIEARFQGFCGEAGVGGERVLLLKPVTYMNLSGQSVGAAARFYKLGLEDVLIIHDDVDLPVGQLRMRASGSAGGQKGLADILRHLSSEQVPRLRIGIGRVHPSATADYVLSRFDPQEREAMDLALVEAVEAAECWLREGIELAMTRYNRRRASDD